MYLRGNCLDNAAVGNLFGHSMEEFLRQRRFKSAIQFRSELDNYIRWLDNDLSRLKLKGLGLFKYQIQPLVAIAPTFI